MLDPLVLTTTGQVWRRRFNTDWILVAAIAFTPWESGRFTIGSDRTDPATVYIGIPEVDGTTPAPRLYRTTDGFTTAPVAVGSAGPHRNMFWTPGFDGNLYGHIGLSGSGALDRSLYRTADGVTWTEFLPVADIGDPEDTQLVDSRPVASLDRIWRVEEHESLDELAGPTSCGEPSLDEVEHFHSAAYAGTTITSVLFASRWWHVTVPNRLIEAFSAESMGASPFADVVLAMAGGGTATSDREFSVCGVPTPGPPPPLPGATLTARPGIAVVHSTGEIATHFPVEWWAAADDDGYTFPNQRLSTPCAAMPLSNSQFLVSAAWRDRTPEPDVTNVRIWQSLDTGASWTTVHEFPDGTAVSFIAVDPTNANHVIVSTSLAGRYVAISYDAGASWAQETLPAGASGTIRCADWMTGSGAPGLAYLPADTPASWSHLRTDF